MALTTTNSGAALVGRSLTTRDAMKTMNVKVLRSFYFNRAVQPVGSTLELPAVFALEMAAAGKVEAVPEPVADPVAESPEPAGAENPVRERKRSAAKS
jgi:saccharopine dehydrogenase-like NADP-dependent oxidoreductase